MNTTKAETHLRTVMVQCIVDSTLTNAWNSNNSNNLILYQNTGMNVYQLCSL